MNVRKRIGLSLVALLTLALGCDFNPTAPFDGFDGQGAGVTLSGTFIGTTSRVTGMRSLAEAPDLLTVIVYSDGEKVASIQVENGSFTLRGLPDGKLWVEFEDGGASVGSYGFSNVLPNQEIELTLEMTDGTVEVISEKRTGIGHGDVELEGIVDSLHAESDHMTGSLKVDGQPVRTRAAETSIRKGNERLNLDDLSNGDRVHVKGVWEEENNESYVFAQEIKLQEEEDDDSGECSNISGGRVGEHIVLEGSVLSGNTQSFVMQVNGNRADGPVNVNFGGTPTCVGQAKKGTCQVVAGSKVNVKGTLVTCDTVQADEVKIQK
jgi:hypothetical protein